MTRHALILIPLRLLSSSVRALEDHAITSSAMASRFGRIVRPSVLAVFMLMANSILAAC